MTGGAAINLQLTAGLGGAFGLPSIETDLKVNWNFDGQNPAGELKVEFTDVRLDANQLIDSFLKPVFGEVNRYLEPIRPLIDFLGTEIPVLSDIPVLAELIVGRPGPVRVVDMIDLLADGGGPAGKLFNIVKAISDVADKLDQYEPSGDDADKEISLGSFSVDPRAPGYSGSTATPQTNAGDALQREDNPATKLVSEIQEELQVTDRGLTIPLLSDPTQGRPAHRRRRGRPPRRRSGRRQPVRRCRGRHPSQSGRQ
jgi:hypothetical protein